MGCALRCPVRYLRVGQTLSRLDLAATSEGLVSGRLTNAWMFCEQESMGKARKTEAGRDSYLLRVIHIHSPNKAARHSTPIGCNSIKDSSYSPFAIKPMLGPLLKFGVVQQSSLEYF